uniref:Uncharacterized protein n=1 Tax=Anguilla anguilla TaxID=7936 RepID=A0A0E9P5P7_ANGAN
MKCLILMTVFQIHETERKCSYVHTFLPLPDSHLLDMSFLRTNVY